MKRVILSCLPVLAVTALLTGCGNRIADVARLPDIRVYQVTVAQGNIVTPETLASLRRGMERRHVKVLIGTPTIADPFHADRWDYPYSVETREQRNLRLVSLHFVDDKLDHLSGDVVGSYALPEMDELAARTTVTVPPRGAGPERSWFARLLPGDRGSGRGTTLAAFRGEAPEETREDAAQTEEPAPQATREVDEDPDAGLFDGLLGRVGE